MTGNGDKTPIRPQTGGDEAIDPAFRSLPTLEAPAISDVVPTSQSDRPAPRTNLIGAILLDRYRVIELLGEGAMGAVFLGEHIRIGRKVAVKVLKLEAARSPEKAKDRFLREARMISAITHDNVVQISDFGTTKDGRPFFVMEYLEGEDLSLLLRREGRQSWMRVKGLAVQICRALRAAHSAGIIHRDMKPANCFMIARADGGDFVKLLDFGVAKIVTGDAHAEAGDQLEDHRLTRTGEVVGSAAYMSPEQAKGEHLDARTDLYSLGVMLYELLTGVRPFDADSSLELMTKHAFEPPRPPSEATPDAGITPAIDGIILKLLAKDRYERYQSATELLEAIELVSIRVMVRPDLAGEILQGRYKLVERIGDGGMGTVYLARHMTLGRRFAVKILHAEYVRLYKARFLQEAKAASAIAHANVIRITDYGEMHTGQPFLVMDFLEGECLSDTFIREGRLPWRRARHIISQICRALQAVHDAGIVHRDIKPENCRRLDNDGDEDFIKVLDFGIAKVTTGGPKLTATGEIFGTAAYMSPEQAVGDSRIDHRTDIYATGVMMYEILAGVRPFEGNDNALLYQHVHALPPRLEDVAPDANIPREAAEIVYKALQKDPAARHASMRDMLDAIMRVPAESGLSASTELPLLHTAPRHEPPPGALTSTLPSAAAVSTATASATATVTAPGVPALEPSMQNPILAPPMPAAQTRQPPGSSFSMAAGFAAVVVLALVGYLITNRSPETEDRSDAGSVAEPASAAEVPSAPQDSATAPPQPQATAPEAGAAQQRADPEPATMDDETTDTGATIEEPVIAKPAPTKKRTFSGTKKTKKKFESPEPPPPITP